MKNRRPSGGDTGRLVVLETHPQAQRERCRFESGPALHSGLDTRSLYLHLSLLFADSRERPATWDCKEGTEICVAGSSPARSHQRRSRRGGVILPFFILTARNRREVLGCCCRRHPGHICRCSSMAEHLPSKQATRVRSPSPAPWVSITTHFHSFLLS